MNIKTDTVDDLRRLVASVDDKRGDHIVWIDIDGHVHITRLESSEAPAAWHARNQGKFKTRLETFGCGNGYLGYAASKDSRWMNEMFDQLQTGWRKRGDSGYEGD